MPCSSEYIVERQFKASTLTASPVFLLSRSSLNYGYFKKNWASGLLHLFVHSKIILSRLFIGNHFLKFNTLYVSYSLPRPDVHIDSMFQFNNFKLDWLFNSLSSVLWSSRRQYSKVKLHIIDRSYNFDQPFKTLFLLT